MLGLAITAGLLAGSYPALALSGFQPVSILKTSAHSGRGALLRKGLVVFQFAATVILVVCTAVVYGQTDYMKSRDLGLDQEHVVVMPIGFADLSLPERYEAVKTRFAEHPNVLSFLETLRIELVAGRNADVHRKAQPEFLLNETAVRRLGWDDPIGRTIEWLNQEGVVVGVVADYHSRSMHSMIEPILLADWLHLVIAVRMAPHDVPETMALVRTRHLHRLPGSARPDRLHLRAAHEGGEHPARPRGRHRQRARSAVARIAVGGGARESGRLADRVVRNAPVAPGLSICDRPAAGDLHRRHRRRPRRGPAHDLLADPAGGVVEPGRRVRHE